MSDEERIGEAGLPPIRIVLSYRRKDAPGAARSLRNDLASQFGVENVFFDIDTIPPGADWVEAIEKTVESCDVLLPLIGPHWLTVTDEQGRRRLDDPNDILRFEIESALKGRVRIIPIQVHGASMPSAGELPESLADLPRRQSIRIDDDDWDHDVTKVVRALQRIRREKAEAIRPTAGEKQKRRAEQQQGPLVDELVAGYDQALTMGPDDVPELVPNAHGITLGNLPVGSYVSAPEAADSGTEAAVWRVVDILLLQKRWWERGVRGTVVMEIVKPATTSTALPAGTEETFGADQVFSMIHVPQQERPS